MNIEKNANRNAYKLDTAWTLNRVICGPAPQRRRSPYAPYRFEQQPDGPPRLCMLGGGSRETGLIPANGQNSGVIGGYTPTNRPR